MARLDSPRVVNIEDLRQLRASADALCRTERPEPLHCQKAPIVQNAIQTDKTFRRCRFTLPAIADLEEDRCPPSSAPHPTIGPSLHRRCFPRLAADFSSPDESTAVRTCVTCRANSTITMSSTE